MNEYVYEENGKEVTTTERMDIPVDTEYQHFFEGVYAGTFIAWRTLGGDFYSFSVY